MVNAGISGGRLLRDGMGESALVRFRRDALDQPAVSSVIVLIGIIRAVQQTYIRRQLTSSPAAARKRP